MTADSIHRAIEKLYPSPAHTIIREVRNGTGFARSPRTIDSLVLSTWPSRGLWIAGIEIKTYLGDFMRELANVEKAEAIQPYCHYWYIAAPEGCVPKDRLPKTWGLIEVNEKGKAKVSVTSPKNESPKHIDMLFLGAICKNLCESYVPKNRVAELAKVQTDNLVEHRTSELTMLKERIAEFEKQSGVSLQESWNFGPIGEAVKMVLDSGLRHYTSKIKLMRHEAAMVVKACDDIISAGVKEIGD